MQVVFTIVALGMILVGMWDYFSWLMAGKPDPDSAITALALIMFGGFLSMEIRKQDAKR